MMDFKFPSENYAKETTGHYISLGVGKDGSDAKD